MKKLLILLLLLPRITWGQASSADPKTFAASSPALGFSAYTSPTDVCTFTGGTDGTPVFFSRVYRVKVSGTATAGNPLTAYLIKRSVADVGNSNSTTAITVIPLDSKKNNYYSTPSYWKSAPNPVGTSIGQIDAQVIPLQPTTSGGSTVPGFVFDYGPTSGLGPIRLYNGEQLAVNLNGATMPAGTSIFCQFWWNEGGPQSNP
jgi:hypothetical protein